MSKLDMLVEPGKHEIRISRTFDAPRELVFKAYTDPDLVPRWWGLSSTTTVVHQLEARMGGVWRFVQKDESGAEYGFRGVYHEITAPERIVHTFEFEGMPGHILLETLTFEERDGKTFITDSSVFQSVEDRDGMLQSGMEQGATESWDRFEALLAELQK